MKLLICTQIVDKNDTNLGFFHRWIEEFSKHFEHVYVICLKEGIHTLPQNVTIFSLGKEGGENNIKYLFRFYRYFSRVFFTLKVDFVFFHMGAIYNILAAPFFILRKIFHTKFYWWKTHGHINFAGRLASIFTDRIYTASANSFPISSKKKFVVGHGIDIYKGLLSKKDIKNKVHIVCVGRITRIKNIERVIELGNILHQRNSIFTISIIGPVIETKYLEELTERIDALGLTDYINFIGPKQTDELHQMYQEADILMHPSKTGSIDKVVLEAMNWGVVPIASCAAYGSILSPFRLCVERDEVEEYLKVLDTLIKMDTDEYNELRMNLQQEVIKKHSLTTLTNRIFNI